MMDRMRVAVESCLHVKPGEEVLIVSDTQMSENIKNGLMAAIRAAGGEVQLLTFVTRSRANEEVPRTVASAIKQADKTIIATTHSMIHTSATKEAVDAGKILLCMPLITEDMILRTWPTSTDELKELRESTVKLARIIDSSKKVRLTSPEGTDLTLEVGKYKTLWNYGVVEKPGLEFMPGGQTATCPVEGTANGQYVIDVSTGFPAYRLVRDPITCIAKDGTVVDIKGGRDAEEFKQYLESLSDPNVFHVAELGTGTNPRCRFTGNALEDERKPGSVRIAVGTDMMFGGKVRAKTHVDGMMSHTTLEFDGKTVIKNGELVI